jgi:DNA-binding beta-propeller fold protein YncE
VVDIDPGSPTYNSVIDLDPSTPEIDRIAIGTPAFNLVVSPDGSLGYVLNVARGTVTVVDLIANKAIDLDPTTPELDGLVYRSDANAADAHDVLAVSPDGSKLYITHPSDNTVSAAKFA